MAQMNLEQMGPTLFIGLGGAGGHVIGRLNRLVDAAFAEDFRRLGGSSPIQFLLLDTDDFEKLDPDVRNSLGRPQQSFVSLSHFNPRRYAEKQLEIHDTDLKRWFDRGALPYLEDVTIHDGASRMRMLGRLCLHHHYHAVEQRIREKVDAALDAAVHTESTRIRPEPSPLRIYLVASSCGGTGSAVFLDVAFMVNRIVRDRGWSPDLTGFVFLPFPYIEANARMDPALEGFYQHNAWAFFEELNYFLAHPERVPEHAMDPDRRYGDRPRPLDQYGRDLMRTIYLIGNHIPSVGTLPLGRPLYEYTAQGIFHTFLTPDEGAIQSHYSNIKSKLKDRDRKFDLVKRFAAFGYAEYRPSQAEYGQKQIAALVHDHWKALQGASLDEDAARDESAKLERTVDTVLRDCDRSAREWRTYLGLDDFAKPEKVPSPYEILGWNGEAHQACNRRKEELSDAAERDLLDKLRKVLDERRNAPPFGIDGEITVLEAFQTAIEQQARVLSESPERPSIALDEGIRERLKDLVDRIPREKGWMRKRVDRSEHDEFVRFAEGIEQKIHQVGREWLQVEVRRGLGGVLQERVLPLVNRRIDELRSISGVLQRNTPPSPTEPDAAEVPTIQKVPPLRMLFDQGLQADADEIRREQRNAVHPELQAAWTEALPELAAGADAAAERFRSRIELAWASCVDRGTRQTNVLAAVRDWAERTNGAAGTDDVRATRPDVPLDHVLARLFPLSTPACPLDRGSVDKTDSVPEIFAVVGPFKDSDDAKARLSLRGTCTLIGGHTADRIAVLQTWYAFSSRALDGMETLRRSYLRRDRRQSLPHIDKRWNERGLFRSTGTDDLNERDEELVARLLALGLVLRDAVGETEIGGRVRFRFDDREGEAPYLLAYRDSGHGHSFHWRDVRAADGFAATWTVLGTAYSARNGRPGGAGRTGDLFAELHEYLASEVRERHDEVLAALSEVEPTEAGAPIKQAYREYIDRLEGTLADEERAGRVKHLDLLRRLKDRLEAHLSRLEREEPLEL